MQQEQKIDLGWGAFAVRMFFITVWLCLSPLLGSAAVSPGWPLPARTVAACLLAAPALAWMLVLRRRRARADELDSGLVALALTTAATQTMLFAPLMLVITLIAVMAGIETGEDLTLQMFKVMCGLAPMGAFIGEWVAQNERRRLARPAV